MVTNFFLEGKEEFQNNNNNYTKHNMIRLIVKIDVIQKFNTSFSIDIWCNKYVLLLPQSTHYYLIKENGIRYLYIKCMLI